MMPTPSGLQSKGTAIGMSSKAMADAKYSLHLSGTGLGGAAGKRSDTFHAGLENFDGDPTAGAKSVRVFESWDKS